MNIPKLIDTAKALAGHPGEKITEGLDGLRDRLKEYTQMGARFAKWRAVLTIGDDPLGRLRQRIPSRGCIELQGAIALVPDVFLYPRHSATRVGTLARQGVQRVGGTTGVAASSEVQWGEYKAAMEWTGA